MSGQQGHAYPPGQGPPPPHPSQNAYPPPGGYVPPQGYGMPPPGQPGYGMPPPGYGMPPPGQPGMPPPGQPGLGMPPPGQPGYGPPPPGQPYGMPPPGAGYPYPGGAAGYPHPAGFKQSSGNESDDSQPGDPGLRSKEGSKKIKCHFENRAGTKVVMCRIDKNGKPHHLFKLKDGKGEKAEFDEGDVLFAMGKKKKRRQVVINNNTVYTVMAEKDGEHKVKAEINRGPDKPKELASEKENDVEVKVKFINRSKKTVQLVWVDYKGKWEKKKVLVPGKCYTTKTYECHSWIAHDVQDDNEGLFMNYGFFYSPWKTRLSKERVIITDDRPFSDSSGSSSDSD